MRGSHFIEKLSPKNSSRLVFLVLYLYLCAMEEQWKAIKGYEGYYEVSNLGRVRSLGNGLTHNKSMTYLRGGNQDGYLIVILWKNGHGTNKRVHRLVAEAFIPNPDNLPQINHKNEDKADNRVENLEWCSAKYNCNYGTRNARAGKGISRPLYAYSEDGSLVGEYSSLRDASEHLGINLHTIGSAMHFKRPTHGLWFSHDKEKSPK